MRIKKTFACQSFADAVIVCVALVTMALSATGCRNRNEIPAKIVGDSMAPALCGRRTIHVCDDCRFEFATQYSSGRSNAVCPNCDHRFLSAGRQQDPDHVTVRPNISAQRWDVVAFEQAEKTFIKRVIGLPGETVSIVGGNVLIDGVVTPKPVSVFDQVKTFVFDSKFIAPRTEGLVSPRLVFNGDRWTVEGGQLIHDANDGSSIDWITYQHRRQFANRFQKDREVEPDGEGGLESDGVAIRDDSTYNQNVTRLLHEVSDLAVQFELELPPGAVFYIRRIIKGRQHQVAFEVSSNGDRIDGKFTDGLEDRTFKCAFREDFQTTSGLRITLSNIDRQIAVTVNQKRCFEFKLRPVVDQSRGVSKPPSTSDGPQLEFGMRSSSRGSVNRLQIWRDVYYFSEFGMPKFRLPVSLKAGEYFVLGDNAAVSNDSRHFGPIKKIIGTVDATGRRRWSAP